MVAEKRKRVVVVGGAARDLALGVADMPEANGTAPVSRRKERLGGKGANIAADVRQLNPDCAVSLIAVLGSDRAGDAVHEDALDLRIDMASMQRRGRTALMIDVVTESGERRVFEHTPPEARLTVEDVTAAETMLSEARIVVLQLHQPAEALVRAAELAPDAVIVLDGGADGADAERLLSLAHVVRANAEEAEMLARRSISDMNDAMRSAAELLDRGPDVVCLAVSGSGDLVAWQGGSQFFPFGETSIVDRTGAGDAYVAGLVTGLLRGETPPQLGERASSAAAIAVQQFGGFTRFA
ncbi:PfkB family carbohydrate kinase [Leucobacter sp. USCH14]|uniref:PfkB family carbohydrate kinase n=1 Tax=Leucobacter sp. USCH14 TaxID=3024838 RepID=UPI0030B2A916